MIKPLEITAFFDGSPGHEKQTRGILAALAARTVITVAEQRVARKGLPAAARDWISCYLAIRTRPAQPDQGRGERLLLGTGSRTHPAMIACRRPGDRLVTCMSPARCFLDGFDLCLIPEHDRPTARDNILVTIGPPGTGKDRGRHQRDRGLILVGGADAGSHRWNSPALISRIGRLLKSDGSMSWTISSSPRTPHECEVRLASLAAGREGVSFHAFAETHPGWIEERYDECAVAWVTADSVSMIFEALTAGCKVGILPVDWKKPENKFQRCIDLLAAQQRVVTWEKWKECEGKGQLQWPTGPPLEEAERCAGEILRRWWPERLR